MNIAITRTREFAVPADAAGPDQARPRHLLEVVSSSKAPADGALPREAAGIGNKDARPAILFGPFRLLPAQRLLLEGNSPVRLGSRALEILIVLLEQHGELVSKKSLMARVWPDTTVVEANLSVHIAALRRALRDGLGGNRYLVNMPGRGYRFVAPIRVLEEGDAESSPPVASASKPVHGIPKLVTAAGDPGDNTREPAEQLHQTHLLAIRGAGGLSNSAVGTARAERRTSAHENGVWLIELGSLTDPSEVARAIATALGVELRSE